jgi:hypothetical protein
MELLGDVAQVEPRFGLFGDSLVLMEDRCSARAKCTMGSNVLDAPSGNRR